MALKIWQIVLIVVTFFLLAYFLYWLKNKSAEKETKNIMASTADNVPKNHEGLEIEVDGVDLKSPYGKLNCVHFESAVFFYTKQNEKNFSKPNTWDIGKNNKEPFWILVNEKDMDNYGYRKFFETFVNKDMEKGRYKIYPSDKLRLFISPTFQKDFTKKTTPAKYRNRFEEITLGETITLGKFVDYCLQKGKKYYMLISEESYQYGPPDKNGYRPSGSITFFKISDKKFKNTKPQVDETPTYREWIYG